MPFLPFLLLPVALLSVITMPVVADGSCTAVKGVPYCYTSEDLDQDDASNSSDDEQPDNTSAGCSDGYCTDWDLNTTPPPRRVPRPKPVPKPRPSPPPAATCPAGTYFVGPTACCPIGTVFSQNKYCVPPSSPPLQTAALSEFQVAAAAAAVSALLWFFVWTHTIIRNAYVRQQMHEAQRAIAVARNLNAKASIAAAEINDFIEMTKKTAYRRGRDGY